jgi:glycosyltransferase involved in cell wall biosynthesis
VTISVCIICFNEETNIKRCLESVLWADEVIVVDSMSQDNTVHIARQYTDCVYENPWPGYEAQKNFALKKATGDWILSVDADEEVTETLHKEIKKTTSNPDLRDGYRIPRRSFYQGRWIKHSGYYPDKQLRLFKRDKSRWVGGRLHERIEVKGTVGDLKSDLLHYPYNGTVSGQLRKIDAFEDLNARDMHEQGKRFGIFLLLFRPVFKFLEVYLLKLGFLDGIPGFIIAVTSSYAMFVRYVKLRELESLY